MEAMSGLQKKLFFAFALILALQTCAFLGKYWLEVRSGHFGGDFICFWQAADWVRHGALSARSTILTAGREPWRGGPRL